MAVTGRSLFARVWQVFWSLVWNFELFVTMDKNCSIDENRLILECLFLKRHGGFILRRKMIKTRNLALLLK